MGLMKWNLKSERDGQALLMLRYNCIVCFHTSFNDRRDSVYGTGDDPCSLWSCIVDLVMYFGYLLQNTPLQFCCLITYISLCTVSHVFCVALDDLCAPPK